MKTKRYLRNREFYGCWMINLSAFSRAEINRMRKHGFQIIEMQKPKKENKKP